MLYSEKYQGQLKYATSQDLDCKTSIKRTLDENLESKNLKSKTKRSHRASRRTACNRGIYSFF